MIFSSGEHRTCGPFFENVLSFYLGQEVLFFLNIFVVFLGPGTSQFTVRDLQFFGIAQDF